MKKVAVIGYGSIGREIIASAKRQEIPNAKIVAVFDKQPQVINSIDNEYGDVHLFSDFDEFYNSQIYSSLDLIIECASKDAVREFGKKIIESKKDLIVLSVGAFSDKEYLAEV
jgi:aspartate dehydrogenase